MAKRRLSLGLTYDRYSETLQLDRIAGWLTPNPTPVNEDYTPSAVEGSLPDIRFLVGTSRAGLLLVDGSRVTRLFVGIDFFGISTFRDRWYAFQRYGGNGRIISFRLDGHTAVDARTEIGGLNRGVHQIDFIDGALWIVDTYRDRIVEVPIEAIGRRWRRAARQHYPVGRSQIGRERANHAHFNSVYARDGDIYLVAHNETVKTRRGSELFLLDADGTVRQREPMGGSCCHNIGILGGEQVTCRSVEGAVAVGGADVLKLDAFVRGLALGLDHHVVGLSPIGVDRVQRNEGEGGVVVTTADFQPVATIRLPGTQVLEVRRVDVADLGLSATPRPDLGRPIA